jgi:vacuolar protein sorting-associated protein 13A/C
MNFLLQTSIVADALNLTRFKIAGKLDTLAVNISNSKYIGLMRLIDISIPHFDDEEATGGIKRGAGIAHTQPRRSLNNIMQPTNIFSTFQPAEYTIDEPYESQHWAQPSARNKKGVSRTLEIVCFGWVDSWSRLSSMP